MVPSRVAGVAVSGRDTTIYVISDLVWLFQSLIVKVSRKEITRSSGSRDPSAAACTVTHTATLLQCVAVCCSVLQCVAVCCSLVQCVAV